MGRARASALVLAAVTASVVFSACGRESVSVNDANASVDRGARIFASHCSGCHTMDVAGAQGGATKVRDRERVDGPNFNVRRECVDQVLYAIRNGGYSGAIMPENIVVGGDAQAIAEFLAKYSGRQAKRVPGSAAVTCGSSSTG